MTSRNRRGFGKSKTSLAIVERAFRGPVEEQHGHILWLSRVIRKMKGEHDVLLKGNAVLYAQRGQKNLQESFSGVVVENLSNYEETIEGLIDDGARLYVYRKDLDRLRISGEQLIPGVVEADLKMYASFFREYHCVWYW